MGHALVIEDTDLSGGGGGSSGMMMLIASSGVWITVYP